MTFSEQPTIFRHVLLLLQESGFTFAQVPSEREGECRYVARHQGKPITLYAAWPTGLLGAAHIVSVHLDTLDPDGAPGDDIPGVEDETSNLLVHVDGQQIDSGSIRRCCLRAVVRKSYAVWRTSIGEGEHEWEAARIKGAREGELFAWTPEGLLAAR